MTAKRFDYKPEPWMDSGSCIGHDPAWWFPDDETGTRVAANEVTRAAKAVCSGCPVRVQCLDYAMRMEPGWTKWGVYGGLTAHDRRELGREAS
jgi:WhiB family redox-sensing transcriptional regulator